MNLIAKMLAWLVPPALMSAGSLAAEGARSSVNMPVGVTAVSQELYQLHMIAFWICVAIGIVVFGVMFYSMYTHRKSRGVIPSTFHESTTLEFLWTIVPFLILMGLAIPATSTLIKIYDTEDADLDVLITGYQWKWKYEYVGKDVSFFSNLLTPREEVYGQAPKGEYYLLDVDKPLVIPAGKKVRFLVTAADVIHSWWVPEFGVKKDAIPGFINETWTRVDQPGVYRGNCTELCGKDHGFMPVVVNVVADEEFDGWLATKQQEAAKERELIAQVFTLDELMERGEGVYGTFCASCHLQGGEGIPGAFPALKGNAVALGAVDEHLDVVLNGVQGSAMQAFGAQLSEVDLAAVVTYERNAWGNNVGDLIQPIDVANFGKGK